MNIVDLGLVYAVAVNPAKVHVEMTMTSRLPDERMMVDAAHDTSRRGSAAGHGCRGHARLEPAVVAREDEQRGQDASSAGASEVAAAVPPSPACPCCCWARWRW